jgi:hypothetical protein
VSARYSPAHGGQAGRLHGPDHAEHVGVEQLDQRGGGATTVPRGMNAFFAGSPG